MEIIRNNEFICIMDNVEVIEKYSFNEEINFKKLIEYLLSLNLSKVINYEDKVEEKTDEEENLIKLIVKILDDYNNKVEEFNKFKEEYSKDN